MLCDKRRLVVVMMLVSLVWSLTMALPPLLGWGHYTPEQNGMRWVTGSLGHAGIVIITTSDDKLVLMLKAETTYLI